MRDCPRVTRIAACQVPDVQDDLDEAVQWIERCAAGATREGARLVAFPEGFLQGYSTQAAVVQRRAIDLAGPAFAAVLQRLAAVRPTLVIGLLERQGSRVFNSAAVIHRGGLTGVYRKRHLAGSEVTAFGAGDESPVFEIEGLRFGINICYDTNFPEASSPLASQGAQLIVCAANNMLRRVTAEAWKRRHNHVRLERARETDLPLISADVTGSTGDRISYGPTAVLHPSQGVLAQVPLMTTGMVVADVGANENVSAWVVAPVM